MFKVDPDPNTRELFSESDVDSPAALKKTSYADLRLMGPPGGSGNYFTLICKVVVQMEFISGTSEQPATKGQPLVWTVAEKCAFIQAFVDVIKQIWDYQFEMKGISGYFHASAAVQFDIVVKTGATIFKHYHLNVTKTDAWKQSYVRGEKPFIGSDAEFDTGDVTGVAKGASMPQRAAAHEFGHMISYDDEYPSDTDPTKPTRPTSNANFLTDKDSLMHGGEVLRQRHYTIFAAWLTKNYKGYTGTSFDDSDPIIWKVDGVMDLSNAKI